MTNMPNRAGLSTFGINYEDRRISLWMQPSSV